MIQGQPTEGIHRARCGAGGVHRAPRPSLGAPPPSPGQHIVLFIGLEALFVSVSEFLSKFHYKFHDVDIIGEIIALGDSSSSSPPPQRWVVTDSSNLLMRGCVLW